MTQHKITLGGKTYPYTARAGTIALENAKGETTCRMFYTAFTLDGADPRTRPVTFLYNGGPGSSTIWLRMGSFGPMRVHVGDATPTPNAPFNLVENQYSLLDRSDLVFVDAPGTGFSRIVAAGQSRAISSASIADVRAFGQFVSRYITTFGRWNSPKFLFGESYGTPRSAMLVNYLQHQGIGINGVVLLSSVLDFSLDWDINFTPTAIGGGDWAFPLYLPTEAAAAWYHNALPGPPTTLRALLPQVEEVRDARVPQRARARREAFAEHVRRRRRETAPIHGTLRELHPPVESARSVLALHDRTLSRQRRDDRALRRAIHVVQSRSRRRPADFDATDSAIDAAFVGERQLLHAAGAGISHDADVSAVDQRLPLSGTGSTTAIFRPTPRRISPTR